MRVNFTVNGEKYSVDADGSSYTLIRHGVNQSKGDNNGKPTEQTLGYYSQIHNAVSRAIKDHLGQQPEEITLREFIERFDKTSEDIKQQIGDK